VIADNRLNDSVPPPHLSPPPRTSQLSHMSPPSARTSEFIGDAARAAIAEECRALRERGR